MTFFSAWATGDSIAKVVVLKLYLWVLLSLMLTINFNSMAPSVVRSWSANFSVRYVVCWCFLCSVCLFLFSGGQRWSRDGNGLKGFRDFLDLRFLSRDCSHSLTSGEPVWSSLRLVWKLMDSTISWGSLCSRPLWRAGDLGEVAQSPADRMSLMSAV